MLSQNSDKHTAYNNKYITYCIISDTQLQISQNCMSTMPDMPKCLAFETEAKLALSWPYYKMSLVQYV